MKLHNTHNHKEITNTSTNTSLLAGNRGPKENRRQKHKITLFGFFIILFKIAMKSVYNRVYRPYFHQFQCHTM